MVCAPLRLGAPLPNWGWVFGDCLNMPAVPLCELFCFPGQMITTSLHVLFTEFVLACAGRVDELLQAYDRERRVLPPPVRMWQWGWTKSAETWNGRIGAAPFCVRPVLLSCESLCLCLSDEA